MSRNDITGDNIASKQTTDAYRDNYARIFSRIKSPQLIEDTGPDVSQAMELFIEEKMLEEMKANVK